MTGGDEELSDGGYGEHGDGCIAAGTKLGAHCLQSASGSEEPFFASRYMLCGYGQLMSLTSVDCQRPEDIYILA